MRVGRGEQERESERAREFFASERVTTTASIPFGRTYVRPCVRAYAKHSHSRAQEFIFIGGTDGEVSQERESQERERERVSRERESQERERERVSRERERESLKRERERESQERERESQERESLKRERERVSRERERERESQESLTRESQESLTRESV